MLTDVLSVTTKGAPPFGIPYSEVGGIHAHFEHVLISQFVLTQTQNDN